MNDNARNEREYDEENIFQFMEKIILLFTTLPFPLQFFKLSNFYLNLLHTISEFSRTMSRSKEKREYWLATGREGGLCERACSFRRGTRETEECVCYGKELNNAFIK